MDVPEKVLKKCDTCAYWVWRYQMGNQNP